MLAVKTDAMTMTSTPSSTREVHVYFLRHSGASLLPEQQTCSRRVRNMEQQERHSWPSKQGHVQPLSSCLASAADAPARLYQSYLVHGPPLTNSGMLRPTSL